MCFIANMITGVRILGSVLLAFTPVFSVPFYAVYLICGLSDMVDGTVARKTNSSSSFGAKFDTAADFLFAAILLAKLLPYIPVPGRLLKWMAVIALIKAVNIGLGIIRNRKLVPVHSTMNKVTGLMRSQRRNIRRIDCNEKREEKAPRMESCSSDCPCLDTDFRLYLHSLWRPWTGASANAEEFAKYEQRFDRIQIPSGTKINALGEATHGNAEFQQLRLTAFRQAVEQYGVRGFALEGNFGGCEQVNRYIHGGNGTAEQAAAAIGFVVYRTQEVADLISYMHTYNASAAPGEDLRFYGFDMQRTSYSADLLMESCNQLGISTAQLEKLFDGGQWNSQYSAAERKDVLSSIKNQLNQMDSSDTSQAIHLADVLSQNAEVDEFTDDEKADGHIWGQS